MAVTVEQQSLVKAIHERLGEIQTAIKQAMPGNAALHAEFGVGQPMPEAPRAVIDLAKKVEPLARENKSLLLSRGVDAGRLAHLAQLTASLERVTPASEPAEAPAKKAGKKK